MGSVTDFYISLKLTDLGIINIAIGWFLHLRVLVLLVFPPLQILMEVRPAPAPASITSAEPGQEHIHQEGSSSTQDCQDNGQVQVENIIDYCKIWP